MALATKLTTNSPAGWRPDRTEYLPDDIIPDALLLQASTVVGGIEGDAPSVRVPYVSGDGSPGFVAEGAEIPDAAQQFSEVVVQTGKIATLGKYSYEVVAQPEAARMIAESLSRSVIRSADAAFLGNAADAAGSTGLLHAGITTGGNIVDSLDPVVDAIADIEGAYGVASHIIADPTAWATLSKLKKATESNESLIGAGTSAAERILLGLPVLVNPSAPVGSVIVMDRRTVVSAVSPVRLTRSDDAYFSSDSVAIRLAWRIGWSVQRPERIVKLTIGSPAVATTKTTTTK